MDLSSIKPLSQWTQEDYYNAARAQGYSQYENEQGGLSWGGGPDGEGGRWRPGEDSGAIAPGDPQQYYNQQLEKAGYAIGGTQLQQWAQRLGTSPEIAAQYIFGPGSQIINDPVHGQVVKAGTFDPSAMNNGWNLPNMEGFGNSGFFGALNNFADQGGIIKLLAGGLTAGLGAALTPTLGGIGANAIVGGGISALTGGDPLSGAVTGGLGAGLPGVGVTDPALIGAIKGATGGLISGGDPLQSAVLGATSGYATSALNSLANGLSPSLSYTASDNTSQPSGMDVRVNPSTGNDSLDRILASNSNSFAGMDSVTGGGPINAGSQSYQDGLNNPLQFISPVINQPKKEEQAAGGKPVSFFDDLLGNTDSVFQSPEGTINPAQIGDPSQIEQGGFDPNSVWNYIQGQLGDAGQGFNLDPSIFQTPDGTINPAQIGQDSSWGVNPGGVLAGLAKFLLGSGATSDQIKRLLTGGGTPEEQGLLNGLFGKSGLAGTAASVAPSLAAINYAQNQSPFDTSALQGLSSQIPTSYNFDTSGLQSLQSQVPNFNIDTSGLTSLQQQVPTSYNFDTSGLQGVMDKIPTNQSFDTSKLTDAYNQFDPNSVTGQYDLNTAAARQGLASSLQSRGVAGSSFGNSDFANFGQQRDVGRQSLINDAITRRAGIANDILTNDKAAAGLNMQGLGLQGQLANNLLDTQKSQASLGLQGLGLQGQFANQAINAQQQNNAQNLQGLGLKNQMAQSLLDNQYRSSALGLQSQGLQRNIFGDVLNAQIASQKNKNDLYGRALLALSGGLSSKSAGIF
jgi:hypothetical protein